MKWSKHHVKWGNQDIFGLALGRWFICKGERVKRVFVKPGTETKQLHYARKEPLSCPTDFDTGEGVFACTAHHSEPKTFGRAQGGSCRRHCWRRRHRERQRR